MHGHIREKAKPFASEEGTKPRGKINTEESENLKKK